ncbi:MAG: segregation and condensation protein A [Betaproteobacteria bacterium]|nr:segregation and condensation protein A [Betaproteobacteria bacterium]
MSDNPNELSKEQQILRAMRKTLTSVARDCAPRADFESPLKTETVENIRMCLGLISAREQELAAALGLNTSARPVMAGGDAAPAAVQPLEFIPPTKH